MAEISKANAILSHEGKKEVYDAYGSKVTKQLHVIDIERFILKGLPSFLAE